jgi:DNA repair protein RecN (Recombination protein N)
MLSRLSIQNYAIIDELDVDFSTHLNVITGETGAGKSIIVGALGLILGQRADSNVLLKKEKKCVVEGCFKEEATDAAILRFLKEAELDVADELTVRREIAVNGKSRAFINDTPVNLSQLNTLSSLLVDLHQQFDTLELGESDFQREVLDALANNFPALSAYRNVFHQTQAAKKSWETLHGQKAQFEKELDYHQFQFNELDEAGFREAELEDMEVELKLLSNAEGIKTALTKAYYDLNESEEPIVRQLKTTLSSIQHFQELHPDLPSVAGRLKSAYIELQDIADEIDRINVHIGSDAERLEAINERLSLGYRLLKKHGVTTTNELIAIRNKLNEKLQAVLNIDEAIVAAEKKYNELTAQAGTMADKISTARLAQLAGWKQR